MKTHQPALKICFTFTLLLLPALCPVSAKEAVYDGKAVSEWLLELKAHPSEEEIEAGAKQGLSFAQVDEQKHRRAEEAIRQLGTNAIPTLINILSASEENNGRPLRKLESSEFRRGFSREGGKYQKNIRRIAVDGFCILGTNGAPAIPQIVQLFQNVYTCSEAAQALALLGSEGVNALTNGLANKDGNVRDEAILAIGGMTSLDSNMVARIMIDRLKDPSVACRWHAIRFLAGKDPAVAIPALLPLLDYSWGADDTTAQALSSYGPAAKAAIPKLLTLYTNAVVQRDRTKISTVSLMSALKAIDMEAARQAEEFLVNSGPLNDARFGYSRTKLTNGLELIAGGYLHTEIPSVTNREISKSELLDPKTGKWTETDELNAARYDHTATLLSDGKVLVKGGAKFSIVNIRQSFWEGNHLVQRYTPTPTRSDVTIAELYDPSTGTWAVVTNK